VPYSHGVYRISPGDSTALQVHLGTPGAEIKSDQVSAIRYTGNTLWIGYEDFGVSRWNLGADQTPLTADDVWTAFSQEDTNRPLIGNTIRRIAIAPDGRVWIGTTSGLSIWNGQTFINIGAGFGRLPTPDVNDILPVADGGAWVSTRNGGLTRLLPREQGGFFYTTYGPPDIPNPNVEALAIGPDGRTVWLATERGLATFLPDEQSALAGAAKIGAYPNPYQPNCTDGLRLLGTGGAARGVIVDLSGRVVTRFPNDGRRTLDPGEPIWNGTDHGKPVAPGVYWIHVQTPRGERSLGVAVLDGECP
jgi:ligand-binding sensor domain-containing protein